MSLCSCSCTFAAGTGTRANGFDLNCRVCSPKQQVYMEHVFQADRCSVGISAQRHCLDWNESRGFQSCLLYLQSRAASLHGAYAPSKYFQWVSMHHVIILTGMEAGGFSLTCGVCSPAWRHSNNSDAIVAPLQRQTACHGIYCCLQNRAHGLLRGA